MNKTAKLFYLLAILLSSNVATVIAQDQNACIELLRHGIYDKFRESSVSASASQLSTHICQAYQEYLQDKKSGSVKASYKMFGGEGSYSAEKISAVGQFMCADMSSSANASNGLSISTDVISQAALDAYRECVSLNSGGLKTNTTFRESDQGQITIEIRYVAPVGAPPQTTVNKIVLAPADCFTCSGPLWDSQGKVNAVGTQAVAMSCTRKMQTTPTNFNGLSVLAVPSTITIMTTAGTVNRSMGPLLAAPPSTPLKIPIGTVISFAGTTEQALTQRQFGWWICDGSTINDPLADPSFKNKSTPDLKDRFLMGSMEEGQKGGSTSYSIPAQSIPVSVVAGDFVVPADANIPALGPHNGSGFGNFHRIRSAGTVPVAGANVATVPPFYTVIYLVKVR